MISEDQDRMVDQHAKSLTTSNFIIPGFEILYKVIGIIGLSRLRWARYVLYFIFNFRIVCGLIAEMSWQVDGDDRKKYQTILSNLILYLLPMIEFFYLFFKLSYLRANFDNFLHDMNVNELNCDDYLKSASKVSLICLIVTGFRLILSFSLAFGQSGETDWIVDRTFFGLIKLNRIMAALIAYPCFLIECLDLMYISLSTSLYLVYAKILFTMKLLILQRLSKSSLSAAFAQLHSLEDLIDTFESTFSILPLNWLLYGLPGCVIYLLSTVTLDDMKPFVVVNISAQSCDFLLALASLFIISIWQEDIDRRAASFIRIFDVRSSNHNLDRLLARTDKLMSRRVTIWHIFPVDRSLILAYIGSTITFSTLLMQITA